MKVVHTRAEFATARADLATPVGYVPTMGALHAGHTALLDAARRDCAAVVATVFVNPMQFGPSEDLDKYPRSLDADLAACEKASVDLVWAPSVDDVYSHGDPVVTVSPGQLGAELEGESRPTHFAGVLTVVAKFLNLIRPQRAYFGEKDYQQLILIRRMAKDLEIGTTIVGVPTVRDRDGLALSSRNAYLSADERKHALALSSALTAGRDAAAEGAIGVLDAAMTVLAGEPDVEVDYLSLRAPDLGRAPAYGEARLLVAARVGSTRLIDNIAVTL
jgi:pantoate--beta-alanine ligase